MTEQVFAGADAGRVVNGPERECCMSESVQIHAETKCLRGPPSDHVIDRAIVHRIALVRHPEPIVLGSIRNTAPEFLEIEVDSPR